jgi:hypothetical protein
VTGLDTTGQRWQAWLNLDIAARLLAEEPEDLEDQLLWLDTPQFHEAVRHLDQLRFPQATQPSPEP